MARPSQANRRALVSPGTRKLSPAMPSDPMPKPKNRIPDPGIEITIPDLKPWRAGNTGTPYVWRFDAAEPGPHAVVVGLIHGNEMCGALALNTLLSAGLRPNRGSISFVFANIEAFERFDPTDPFRTRFVDEDMNRIWSPEVLDGSRNSIELARAREIRSVIESADYLLDLHSMMRPNQPLALTGVADRGLALAAGVGAPEMVVVDEGHASGTRLRDHPRFVETDSAATALLVECGQHWAQDSSDLALALTLRFLTHLGLVSENAASSLTPQHRSLEIDAQQIVHVTEAISPRTDAFQFVEPFRGVEIIKDAGTIIAHDGGTPVKTPYDRCVLILPARRTRPGQTAVRLGRFG
ncbi:MAG: succinylglutamate desuccinylase/aspartoacylase family protein [Pseudomonadota bacterium]